MTRRDYIAVAEVLRRNRPKHFGMIDSDFTIWRNLRDDFARMLAEDNPRFDVDRFRLATEVTP